MKKMISSCSLTEFENVIAELDKCYAALRLLWMELLQPKLDKQYADAVRSLMWDRLSLLDQAVFDVHTFCNCVYSGREFGSVNDCEV